MTDVTVVNARTSESRRQTDDGRRPQPVLTWVPRRRHRCCVTATWSATIWTWPADRLDSAARGCRGPTVAATWCRCADPASEQGVQERPRQDSNLGTRFRNLQKRFLVVRLNLFGQVRWGARSLHPRRIYLFRAVDGQLDGQFWDPEALSADAAEAPRFSRRERATYPSHMIPTPWSISRVGSRTCAVSSWRRRVSNVAALPRGRWGSVM